MGEANRLIGQVLNDTYRIERLIGEGGMGSVYEASHLRLARRFAIKVLSSTIAKNPEALARFGREAKITSAIGHPHIVEVTDCNSTEEGTPFIVMELLVGEDLAQRIRRQGPLDLSLVASIFKQASSALQAAHQMGVVHRDLKPQNIFLCRRGGLDHFVKLVDFGVSKVVGSQDGLTKSRSFLGTPHYMSPEQAEQDTASVDLRSDVYAMAAIMYEMISGQPPFSADSVPTLVYRIVHKQPPPLRSQRPDLPRSVELVVKKAMRKDREKRFSDMAQFWQAFALALDKEGIALPEPSEELPQEGADERPTVATGMGMATTVSSSMGEVRTTWKPRARSAKVAAITTVAVTVVVGALVAVLIATRADKTPTPTLPVVQGARAPTPDAPATTKTLAPDGLVPRPRAPQLRPLWLASRPADAAVFHGKTLLGKTPLMGVGVPTRALTLSVTKPGYEDLALTVEQGTATANLGSVDLKARPRPVTAKRRAKPPRTPAAKQVAPPKPAEPPPPKTRKDWIIEPEIE